MTLYEILDMEIIDIECTISLTTCNGMITCDSVDFLKNAVSKTILDSEIDRISPAEDYTLEILLDWSK